MEAISMDEWEKNYLKESYTMEKWQYMIELTFGYLSALYILILSASICLLLYIAPESLEVWLMLIIIIDSIIAMILFVPFYNWIEGSERFQNKYNIKFNAKYSHWMKEMD